MLLLIKSVEILTDKKICFTRRVFASLFVKGPPNSAKENWLNKKLVESNEAKMQYN
jgi:hypothetical protein